VSNEAKALECCVCVCVYVDRFLNPCPAEDRAYADTNHTGGLEALYWGCTYNEKKDKRTQNLQTPLRKDSFQVWQRSWAVIRFKADAPGVWQFHCHMEQHIPLGMIMALNIKPSQQPKIPDDVPTEGPCPVWSDNTTTTTFNRGDARGLADAFAKLEEENERLRDELKKAQGKCEV